MFSDVFFLFFSGYTQNGLILDRKIEEMRRLLRRQFSQIEIENIRSAFKKARECTQETVADGQMHLKEVECAHEFDEQQGEKTLYEEISERIEMLKQAVALEEKIEERVDPDYLLEQTIEDFLNDY